MVTDAKPPSTRSRVTCDGHFALCSRPIGARSTDVPRLNRPALHKMSITLDRTSRDLLDAATAHYGISRSDLVRFVIRRTYGDAADRAACDALLRRPGHGTDPAPQVATIA